MKKSRISPFIPKSWDLLFHHYKWHYFKSDLFAGITVGLIALPLALAFAIASGVPPEKGLYTAVIAGFLISLLGGSRYQIGGPTGAFVVIIYSVMQRHGYDGLVFVTLLAGVILLIASICKLGDWIKFIPYPLVTGFTTGIAFIIFSSQVKDFLGLEIAQVPADFIDKWRAIITSIHTIHWPALCISAGTLLVILVIRKFFPILPWGITSVALATAVTWTFEIPVETIYTKFGELSKTFPTPSLFGFSIHSDQWASYMADAFTIAFLAGIESLLSAIVADGMAGTKHKSNCELMAQGIANIASVSLGGIPATGAIARTAANVKSGAKTPLAGMIHSVTLLLILIFFSPIVKEVSLASLAAVLMMIAWNMSEIGHFRRLFKAPLGDVGVLLTTFFLTVLADLTVAVGVGMVLASFLFMKRVGDISKVVSLIDLQKAEAIEEEVYDIDAIDRKSVPSQVEVYEIAGPFFFGVADSLKTVLVNIERTPKVFILRMRKVPAIDASGMHALREFFFKCQKQGVLLLLSGVSPSLKHNLQKFGIVQDLGKDHIFSHIDHALAFATRILEGR
jgi:SulP family sulfate permease